MIILGCDTSCDDTTVGIIDYDINTKTTKILCDVRISQFKDCLKYGGVVPEIAARNHLN